MKNFEIPPEIKAVINCFYPEDDDLKRTLIKHSTQVCIKALQLAERSPRRVDTGIVAAGAMLHDIGIKNCNAPGIFCRGPLPYLRHGLEGAEMLKQYGSENNIDLNVFADICARHTGSGLTAEEIIASELPLPPIDLLPETPEEKLICLADKFFSKSGTMEEKSFETVRRSMEKFGPASLKRFDEMWKYFGLPR